MPRETRPGRTGDRGRYLMVVHRITDTRGWRPDRVVAAVARRVAVGVPCVAAIAASASAAPPDDRDVEAPATADLAAAAGEALVGSALGRLFGVLLVLLVLAGIGVAAWGARPDGLGRLHRATSFQQWAPGGRVGGDDAPPDAAADGDLLTDEERIIGLLEESGGRLKQQHVVETTDWSKAKVSRVLSSMEDEGAIVRIQLGREKLIFLSGHEPSGARPTHRED